MATATVGAVQHTPTSRIQQDAESTALKTVHFDSMEKDTVAASVSEKSSERFLPPIEDKKAAKESNNKVVCVALPACTDILQQFNYLIAYSVVVLVCTPRPTPSPSVYLRSCC